MAHAGDVGNLGVRIFFVISGFLITHLLLVERGRSGTISLKAFYMRRALRILPAFYVFVGVAALLTAWGVLENDRRDFFHALTYTMNYRGTTDHFSLRHLWSLAVEEQFYLIWPAVVVFCTVRGAAGVAAGVLLVVPMLRVVLFHVIPGYETYMFTGFESVSDALASGAALAIVFPRLERSPWFDKVLLSPAFPLVFIAIALANAQTDHPHFLWVVGIPLMNVLIALVMARYVRHPHLPLARLLNTPAAVTIGTLSYSLYLWQELFLIQWRPVTSVLQQFPWNLVAASACALLSYALVEQPFLRLKSRFDAAPASAARPETVSDLSQTAKALIAPGHRA